MPDYGHPLRFGTFIQPSNQQPELTVTLAQRSEELGYDLVTFQDHPYQPAYLDTWTLMTWVAARTDRIHIASNVLNLPLRPPAVMARAAASLDLLSAGRFDLGLGAGGFWDAIEAMGGRRLTPGQSIEAMDEAIDVIRGIWAATERTPLRLDGEHYSLRARLDEAWEDMYRHVRGLYLSFETDTRPERLADAFPPATLDRLRTLKRRYDPDNVFRDNFNIAPDPT